ncbi:MAG TPA: hypothetical protein VGK25_11435, partial [Ignavibacteria bacterium]
MKKTILIFVSSALFAQSGFSSGHNPHDSLLFDGAEKVQFRNSDDCIPDTSCLMKVYSITGTATGTVMWDTLEDVSACGPAE